MNAEPLREKQRLIDLMKFAVIIISTVPIMCLYPFLRKRFVKDVMIGVIKGKNV